LALVRQAVPPDQVLVDVDGRLAEQGLVRQQIAQPVLRQVAPLDGGPHGRHGYLDAHALEPALAGRRPAQVGDQALNVQRVGNGLGHGRYLAETLPNLQPNFVACCILQINTGGHTVTG
jgi:hypothetical protein